MRHSPIWLALLLGSACSPNALVEPSLAPRDAESIDPRVPIPDATPRGTLDAAIVERLDSLVGHARDGATTFAAREAEASRLADAAGPMPGESWIAAQQALSRLIEQYGVTTRAAADIDQLASTLLEDRGWIEPADREAIAAAAAEVASISSAQAAAIDRLASQLRR